MPRTIVVMGVSGAGKTMIGGLLAQSLVGKFVDTDELHPPANLDKMGGGIALSEQDREPWLDAVGDLISDHDGERPLVIACSALRRAHREKLNRQSYVLVFLKGPFELISRRLSQRKGHFMAPSLLESQFATLEAPDDAIIADIHLPPEDIVGAILTDLENLGWVF